MSAYHGTPVAWGINDDALQSYVHQVLKAFMLLNNNRKPQFHLELRNDAAEQNNAMTV